MLATLILRNQIKMHSAEDWKRTITPAENTNIELSPNNAKVRFLKLIYQWPLFGVRQTTKPQYPKKHRYSY
jgi:myosin-7